MNATFKNRHLTIAHTCALRIDRMDQKDAAVTPGNESRDVMHPAVAAAQLATTDEPEPVMTRHPADFEFAESLQYGFGCKADTPVAVKNAPGDARFKRTEIDAMRELGQSLEAQSFRPR